jgi:hypothetical protein
LPDFKKGIYGEIKAVKGRPTGSYAQSRAYISDLDDKSDTTNGKYGVLFFVTVKDTDLSYFPSYAAGNEKEDKGTVRNVVIVRSYVNVICDKSKWKLKVIATDDLYKPAGLKATPTLIVSNRSRGGSEAFQAFSRIEL